jgi:hypothetical protein
MPAFSCRWISFASVLALALAASSARADDPVAAQASFEEGKQLMVAGRYTEACLKFDASQRAEPGLGTQFHLADCWQHVGRLASAWTLFQAVESAAHARGEGGRERVAHDRAVALEPFVPKVAIDLHGASATPGLAIRRDGVEVPREQWGTALPIDPGSHTVAIYAPGKQPWGTGIEVPLNGAGLLTIDVPPLADFADLPSVATTTAASRAAPPAPSATAPSATLAATPPAPIAAAPIAAAPLAPIAANAGQSDARERDARGVTSAMPEGPPAAEEPIGGDRGGARKAAGWILVGAGVASLGAGAYFTTQWLRDRHESNSHCPGNVCDPTGTQQRHDATTQGIAALVAGGSGLVALVTGALLEATAPAPRAVTAQAAGPAARAAHLEIVPVVGAHQGGLGLSGAW